MPSTPAPFSPCPRQRPSRRSLFFFFNDTATTEIYTLSLHDALPISARWRPTSRSARSWTRQTGSSTISLILRDRKSTRLNSSHVRISYAVFCLKKKITTASDLAPSTHKSPYDSAPAFFLPSARFVLP